MPKRFLQYGLGVVFILALLGSFLIPRVQISLKIHTNKDANAQLFWDVGDGYIEENSTLLSLKKNPEFINYTVNLPSEPWRAIRLDPMDVIGVLELQSIAIEGRFSQRVFTGEELKSMLVPLNQVSINSDEYQIYKIESFGTDPYLEISGLHQVYQEMLFKERLVLFILFFLFCFCLLWIVNLLKNSFRRDYRHLLEKIVFTGLVFLFFYTICGVFIKSPLLLYVDVEGLKQADRWQVFYDTGQGFNEDDSVSVKAIASTGKQRLEFILPVLDISALRIDPGMQNKMLLINDLGLKGFFELDGAQIIEKFRPANQISNFYEEAGSVHLETSGEDPFLISSSEFPVLSSLASYQGLARTFNWSRSLLFLLTGFITLVFLCFFEKLRTILDRFFKTDLVKKIPITLYIIVGIFLVKAFALALFITPLCDVPDEPGHFAYIEHLSEGKGFPVLGEEMVKPDLINICNIQNRNDDGIAQHPPLYYLAGTPVLMISEFFTNDLGTLMRTIRLLTVFAGAAGLFLFFLIFAEISESKKFALFLTAAISFIPMYSHMAAGVNHDVFLTMLAASAILFWIKLIKHGRFKNAIWMAIFLSLACVTKATALGIVLPMLFISYFFTKGKNFWQKTLKFLSIVGITASLPVMWSIRNMLNLGVPFFVSKAQLNAAGKQLSISMLNFLREVPVLDETYKNFIALMGYIGTGFGNITLLQISGKYLFVWSGLFFITLLATIIWFFKYFFKINKKEAYLYLGAVFVVVMALLLLPLASSTLLARLVLAIAIALLLGAAHLIISKKDKKQDKTAQIIMLSLLVIGFFLLIYVFNLREVYEIKGRISATHGRYLFPLIPLLGIAYILPAYKLCSPKGSWLLVVVGILAYIEASFFLDKVIHFYLI